MAGMIVRQRWWPRKVLADLDMVLRADSDFHCILEEQVARWDRDHDELTADPLALSMTLDLANFLPKWLGSENQRILLAYETVFGSRSDSIAKSLALACNEVVNEQARQRRAERGKDRRLKAEDQAEQKKLDRQYIDEQGKGRK